MESCVDSFDRLIVRALTDDGRMSWTKLAELVHLSASACQRRVESLLESGVIEHFTLKLNDRRAGNSVKAFIAVNVERQDTERADALRRHLIEHEQVQSAHMVSGGIDFMLEVVARDLEDLARFLDDDLLQVPSVRDATSSIVLKPIKTHQAVLG